MRVYFSGPGALVPEQFLDGPEVVAVFKKVCGEGVSEDFWGYRMLDVREVCGAA